MKITCLSRGSGFHFPPSYILDVSGFRILIDCPVDLSAISVFSPVPTDFFTESDEEISGSLDVEMGITKRQKTEKPLDAKNLIYAEPWYKTAKSLHLWDPSSIDVVLISSTMGMLGLPFLTQKKGFTAKIYVTEATARLGQLMMEDLVSMHVEFQQVYGCKESDSPQWMKWDELELLPSALRDVFLGKDGAELGGWMPLYSAVDIRCCVQKVQTLRYGEAACHNGTLVIMAFSSGLEIGSCNWKISSPKTNIAYVSSSVFAPAHAMEFDFHALQGNDLILYSDISSRVTIPDSEHDNNRSASATNNLSTLSIDEDNWKELNEVLLSNDEHLEEREKLDFICSCVVDSIRAGGSVLFPLNRLSILLQLLEQIPILLESFAVTAPIYMISSIAAELLAFINIIPEWLCKQRQHKLFSGEPLFSHVDLLKVKKLHVFPAVHSPELIANWQEPCIIFSPHWSLRLGPVVHFLRRWCGDQNSLLVLEDGVDVDVALLPYKPIAMKVLQCSFLSGIRLQKAEPLLRILQPKVIVLSEDLRQQIHFPASSSHLVHYHAENETLYIPSWKDSSDLEIETDLASRFSWKNLIQSGINITRLEGELTMDNGKHRLVSRNKVADSSQHRPSLIWGSLDPEKLLTAMSGMGINGTIEQNESEDKSGSSAIIHVHDPTTATIELQATRTVVSTPDENLAACISEAIGTVLDGI